MQSTIQIRSLRQSSFFSYLCFHSTLDYLYYRTYHLSVYFSNQTVNRSRVRGKHSSRSSAPHAAGVQKRLNQLLDKATPAPAARVGGARLCRWAGGAANGQTPRDCRSLRRSRNQVWTLSSYFNEYLPLRFQIIITLSLLFSRAVPTHQSPVAHTRLFLMEPS